MDRSDLKTKQVFFFNSTLNFTIKLCHTIFTPATQSPSQYKNYEDFFSDCQIDRTKYNFRIFIIPIFLCENYGYVANKSKINSPFQYIRSPNVSNSELMFQANMAPNIEQRALKVLL